MGKNTPDIIMHIRKENKLTRKALSELSGFKERTILSYERKENNPPKEYIKFMSLYFNVSEDYINGVSDENKPLNELYRVFEMYKEIYPQNVKKMNEVFKKYEVLYYEDERFNIKTGAFRNIIKELNISYSSFKSALLSEHLHDVVTSVLNSIKNNKLNEKEIVDDGIVISKEFYLSVIKKRNEPNIFIPLENRTIDFNTNLEIDKTLKDMNLKIANFNKEIDKTLKDIQKMKDDLVSKIQK